MIEAEARGKIKTLKGRICRFPFYEPREFGKKGFYKTKEEAIEEEGEGQYNALVLIRRELNISVDNEKQAKEIARKMETCVQLKIPSKVDYALADNWGDAK